MEAVQSSKRRGDRPVLLAASDKFRAELAWRPEKPDLETMVSEAWNWMQAHPDGY